MWTDDWPLVCERRAAQREAHVHFWTMTVRARTERMLLNMLLYGTAFWRESPLGPHVVPNEQVVLR